MVELGKVDQHPSSQSRVLPAEWKLQKSSVAPCASIDDTMVFLDYLYICPQSMTNAVYELKEL